MQLPTWTVIDTVPATSPDAPLATFDAVVKLTQNRPIGSKLTYIYTGGSWVHARGAGGLDKWTDERQPYGGAVELTQWRWKVEEKVLACEYCDQIPHPQTDLFSYCRPRHRYQTVCLVRSLRLPHRYDGIRSRYEGWKGAELQGGRKGRYEAVDNTCG